MDQQQINKLTLNG